MSERKYSGCSHSFDTGIAQNLGLAAAIVFNHIVYWLRINASKNTNVHQGKVWMYETQEEIANFLGYLTIDEVKKAIIKLLKEGYLIKSNFNSNPFDRTNWYTVYDQDIILNQVRVSNKSFDSAKSHNAGCHTALSDRAIRHDAESPSAPCIYNVQKEHIQKEQQQQAAPAADAAVSSIQKKGEPKLTFCPSLHAVDIPITDKQEIASKYDQSTIDNAIAWAMHPSNPPHKCLAASIKYACRNGYTPKDLEQVKKELQPKQPTPAASIASFCRSYWEQVYTMLHKRGVTRSDLQIRDSGTEYLEIGVDKLYYKDGFAFLEGLESYLRKKSITYTDIYGLIRSCKEDLQGRK